MTQPIIFRQYAIVTENGNMTADELENIPLMEMRIAQDNEILWETYPIVCSKSLRKMTLTWDFRKHLPQADHLEPYGLGL